MGKRIEWIDIAKGISILCIIAGHMGIDTVDRIVFTFHVPIFFLISGYFISVETDFWSFAKKRAKGLLLPYIFTSFLLIIARIPVGIVNGESNLILSEMKDVFIKALYASGSASNKTIGDIQPIGAIWFLLALLWALLLVKLLINKKYGFIGILAIAIISYITSKDVWLPWSLQSGG